jgi:transposase InsO family protein
VVKELALPLRTVQRLYRRFEDWGERGIAPDYAQCGQHQPQKTPESILQNAQTLRAEHPTWGAELIRIFLEADQPRPSARTLQRWFRKQATPKAPPGRRPEADSQRAQTPHEVWQMDAKEWVLLNSGQRVSWLRVVEEFTGAVLGTWVFEQGHFASVTASAVRQTLRDLFFQWGRPKRFRVDNGHPWGSAGDLPTDLALWLIGLNLQMIWNPPRQPQKNGVVERSQGVGKNWAEPGACQSAQELQTRLNEMDRIQREVYPYQGGPSRLATYPQLNSSGRTYSRDWETNTWNLTRVLDHLREYVVSRRVDSAGTVSIYNRRYYVGKQHHGKLMYVYLDPLEISWIFSNPDGEQLRIHPAEQITKDAIMKLQVTNRRTKKSPKRQL